MLRRTLIACLAYLLLQVSAGAQEPGDIDNELEPGPAPVTIDGVYLFSVSGSASFPSAERARNITARIVAAAEDAAIAPDAVVTQPHEGRVDIAAGGRHLAAVVASDAALEGISVADTAMVRALRIREAIERYRADRSPDRIAESVLIATIAASIAALLLLCVIRGFRRLFNAFERRYRKRMTSLSIQSFEVVRAESIWRGVRTAMSTVRTVLIVAILYVLSAFVMQQFPWTRSLAGHQVDLITGPLRTMADGLVDYVPKLAFLVVLFLLVRYLLKLFKLFFDAVAAGRVPLSGFDAEWAQPTYHIARILTVLLALVIAYPYLPGSGSAAFQGLSIFAGLMLSLGASSAMASLIAGYTVTYRRAFRVGDRITVGEFSGEVTEIRLMVTHLRTPKNEEIIVPNSVVLQSHVINYSKLAKTRGLMLHTTVSIGYETPWRQVEGMLLLAAQRTGSLLSVPAPFVLEKSLGDFAVTYELNACVDSAVGIHERYAALHRNILDVFNEYGVQIMTPAYEGDPPQPKIVPQEQWFLEPAVRA